MGSETKICALCGRKTPHEYLEKHHLIPRSKSGKITALFCCDCGNQVHVLFSNKELQQQYNSIESLQSNKRVKEWISWIRHKPNKFGICMKSKKRKRR
jgi:5-methylcytosine-specific restriction endonuclease McrA